MADMKTLTLNGTTYTIVDGTALHEGWLPTIAEIGAAPAGYGLGTSCIAVDDWNNAIKNGKWKSATNSPDGNMWYGYTINYTDNYVIQHAFAIETTNNFVKHAMRVMSQSVWYPWEYENPPMHLGVEYRTTERWDGQPVYIKSLDCGALPNASEKTLTHNSGATDYVPIAHGLITSNRRLIVSMGYDDIISRTSPIKVLVGPYTIRIINEIDMSAYTATVWIKYIKT